MSTSHLPAQPTWSDILALWRISAPSNRQAYLRVAEDFSLSSFEVARAWFTGGVPMEYWERLIVLLEHRWGIIVSERQLVRATVALRSSRKQDAA